MIESTNIEYPYVFCRVILKNLLSLWTTPCEWFSPIDRDYFRKNYLNPAIEQGFVALTIPDKPTSSKQQYYLTDKGKEFLKTLK